MAFLLDSSPVSWCSREVLHLEICRAVARRDVRPVVVFAEIPSDLQARFENEGVAVEAVNYRKGPVRYFREMRRIFRQYDVDSVDIEFFRYFDLVHWMARANGARHVVFTESNSGVLRARGWKRALVRTRARTATAPVSRVVAISHYIKQQMIRLGLDESRITVVHKGVDTNRYRSNGDARRLLVEQYGIAPDEIILGSVSFLKPFKHPEVLIEAAGILRERGCPFRLFIAGEGELRAALERRAAELGIAGQLHWLGHLARPEEVVCGWDVFLLASVGEAFGFVLAEAMACGVPVIATNSGGIPEIVEHERSGLVVPPLDAAAFAAAILRLKEHGDLRCQMAERSLERAHTQFPVSTAVENTLRVYESLWAE
jgi:glycosyltransferase involved in cell wall biosynthesis